MHHVVDLDLHPNEASGLAACDAPVLTEALGLDPLYWTVLDEGPVESCLALIGQRRDANSPDAGWTALKLEANVTTPPIETDDGEAIAVHDGWVYVFGSNYGKKRGPLKVERCFVARFRESAVRVESAGTVHADIEVAPAPFLLHQIVNDALIESGVALIGMSHRYRDKMLEEARQEAWDAGADWAARLSADDTPINIEGACFGASGSLLLGLRVPCTRYGDAIVVEVHHPERLFDDVDGEPEPGSVYVLEGSGNRYAPVGVRDLHFDVQRRTLHAVVGNLDSKAEKSLLLQEHPEGEAAMCEHVCARWPAAEDVANAADVEASADGLVAMDGETVSRPVGRVFRLETEHVHRFEDLYRVEGIAADAKGRFLFVSDEDDAVRTHIFTEGDATIDADD